MSGRLSRRKAIALRSASLAGCPIAMTFAMGVPGDRELVG